MRQLAVWAVLLLAAGAGSALARKPCEELKAEIAKKIEANNVKSYTLEIVPKDQEAEGKVVGACDGGTNKIMYRRTEAPPPSPVAEPKQK
jgi:hypothetical protein